MRARRTYQETQDRERELGGETNPRMKTEHGGNAEKRKQKGKMQNKCPKHSRENRETSTRPMHPDRTRGTQLIKHQNRHKCTIHGI